MAKIYGQIESLRKLREELNNNEINDINSIGEIKDFLKNYEHLKDKLYEKAKSLVENELIKLNETNLNIKGIIKKTRKNI